MKRLPLVVAIVPWSPPSDLSLGSGSRALEDHRHAMARSRRVQKLTLRRGTRGSDRPAHPASVRRRLSPEDMGDGRSPLGVRTSRPR
jgi:hypothetical protein